MDEELRAAIEELLLSGEPHSGSDDVVVSRLAWDKVRRLYWPAATDALKALIRA